MIRKMGGGRAGNFWDAYYIVVQQMNIPERLRGLFRKKSGKRLAQVAELRDNVLEFTAARG